MKIVVSMFLIAIVLSAGPAPVAPINVSKLPWVSDALKAPCDKTVLEYKLATCRITPERVKLNEFLDITELTPKIIEKGLVVRIDTAFRPGVAPKYADARWPSIVDGSSRNAGIIAARRFGDGAAFEDCRNLYVLFCVEGQLVALRTLDYYKTLNPTTPLTGQRQAAAELLAH